MNASDDAPAHLIPLPRAAVLILWTSAYLRGDLGPDDAAELSYGAGRSTPGAQGVDLFSWMTGVRRLPLLELRLVLPRPGRPAGLVGPPEAVASALEAEQAVVVTAAGLAEHTLIPQLHAVESAGTRGTAVDWLRVEAPVGAHLPPGGPSGSARETLLRALHAAASGTIDLDLVPEEAVEPARIPEGWVSGALPRHLEARTAHLVTLASRTVLLTRAELEEGPSGMVDLAGESARRAVLEELHDAAVDALVEAIAHAWAPEAP